MGLGRQKGNTMFEKMLVPIYVCFLIITNQIPLNHNSWTDRADPTIDEAISYAKVPANTQEYLNVKAINPETGKKLPYRIKRVGGYEPGRQYIRIDHKGQYVRKIDYISKTTYLKAIKQDND